MADKAETPEEWAICEILGHNRTAGRCQEVTRFGTVMLRVDRPHDDGTFTTEFYGGSSIYALSAVRRGPGARGGWPAV